MIQHPGPWSALVTLPLPPTGETLRRVLYLERLVLEWRPTLETLPAFNRLLVTGQPSRWDPAAISVKLDQLESRVVSEPAPRPISLAESITLPACYDPEVAPDLVDVAALTKVAIRDLVRLHVEATYTVLATGFSPGFAYLGDTAPALAVPRKPTPRQSVPAGSIGLADRRTGVYPSSGPGGWQLIGRVPPDLFADANQRLTRFSAGQSVTFRAISLQDFEKES